ncbi:secreted protein, partial [Candidatus Thiomargarita nelsonii]
MNHKMHKLFSALSQKRKPISKTIFFLLFLGFGLFTVGYEWLLPNEPPEIQTISWNKPLVIEQPTTLEVILIDKEQNINELHVSLENNNFFTLQSHTKKSKNGHHQFLFEILPKIVANNEPIILHYSDGTHALTKAITINIPRLPPQISRIAPNSPLTVTLGEVSTLEIDLEHTEKNPDEISVSLEMEPDLISVLSSEKKIVTDNKMTFRFEILPNNVGNNKEIIIHYGADKLLSQRILVNSNMPYFFNKNGSTFVERLLAPDESIYASHLTVWRENNEHTLVTGHPTSNIFTEVSGTLFNYAVNSANFDDSNFFLGAGLASLPKDDEKWVQKYLDEFKPFKKTFAYISSQYEGLDNLKSLSIALKSHLTTQEEHDIDRFKELTSSENLTKAQENFLRSLINNPTQALDIRQKATWKDFSIF